MAGPNHGLTTLALNLDWRAVLDIQTHFLCLQERSAPVPIQLVIHQPMSEVFRRFSFGVLKRCHQVYPLSIFSHDTNVWRGNYDLRTTMLNSSFKGHPSFIIPHFFPVVQNATGLRLGTWIGTSPCPRHKEQKKSLLKNPKGTSCPRPGSVARELRLWKHHNKNYDTSWLKLASITIELLTISAIS